VSRAAAAVLQALLQRCDLESRRSRAEALEQAVQRVAEHFRITRLRQRTSRIARGEVLATIQLVANCFTDQPQGRACALELFACAMNVRFLPLELFDRSADLALKDVKALLHRPNRRGERL
jgi:hypothetical protein